jgi:glycosyltransferase involved in cell wall biosynthesis
VKVLNVTAMLNPLLGGGIAERTIQMSHFQHKAGIECSVLTIDSGITDELTEYLDGIKIVALPYISDRFHIPLPLLLTIGRLVKASDIVHLISHWTILNVLVYLCIVWYRKPYVVCPAGALKKFGRSGLLKTIFNWFIGIKIIKNASICLAVTHDEVAHFTAYGVSEDDVVVIPNGIVIDSRKPNMEDEFRRKTQLKSNPYILFMGRLNPIKGTDLLIDAFCKWQRESGSDYHLVVAGSDGGLLPSLQAKVSDAGLEEIVHFTDFLSGEEKQQAYLSADLLMIPSRSEAMSIVVLEAAVFNTPALVTNMCGLNYLEEKEYGWVCEATSDSICRGLALSLNATDRLIRGKNFKIFVESNFEWSRLIVKYNALYKSIM